MSRLAEAEAKLNAALDALESAIDTAVAERPDRAAEPAPAPDNGVDRAKVMAEIERIDGQLATALQLISNVQRSDNAEGGTA